MTTNNWVYNGGVMRFNQEGEAYIININQRLHNNKTLKGCVAKNISNVKTQLVRDLKKVRNNSSRGIYICKMMTNNK
jgi:hypothetical protein